jgi:hypothetical protein
MTLQPAYGRDYKSKKEIQADLDAGKDFICADMFGPAAGQLINLEGLRELGQTMVNVRYKQNRAVTVIKVPS